MKVSRWLEEKSWVTYVLLFVFDFYQLPVNSKKCFLVSKSYCLQKLLQKSYFLSILFSSCYFFGTFFTLKTKARLEIM